MYWSELGNMNSLWEEMRDLQNRLNGAFGSDRTYPGIRLYQKEDKVVLHAEIPGVRPDDLNLTVQDDYLTISFERKNDPSEQKGRILRSERPQGRRSRTIRLPFRVDSNRVEAEFKKGLLLVNLPMVEEDKPRKIAVKAS